MRSRFVNMCLALIVLLLIVIASQPLFQPRRAQAAGSVQYRVANPTAACDDGEPAGCQQFLNDMGRHGWRLVAHFRAVTGS
jgi:hypothetical protein